MHGQPPALNHSTSKQGCLDLDPVAPSHPRALHSCYTAASSVWARLCQPATRTRLSWQLVKGLQNKI